MESILKHLQLSYVNIFAMSYSVSNERWNVLVAIVATYRERVWHAPYVMQAEFLLLHSFIKEKQKTWMLNIGTCLELNI